MFGVAVFVVACCGSLVLLFVDVYICLVLCVCSLWFAAVGCWLLFMVCSFVFVVRCGLLFVVGCLLLCVVRCLLLCDAVRCCCL